MDAAHSSMGHFAMGHTKFEAKQDLNEASDNDIPLSCFQVKKLIIPISITHDTSTSLKSFISLVTV
jgi:hypothetical protein